MDFGVKSEERLIGKFDVGFQCINMHLEFLVLSKRLQIWIARKKLADSLRNVLLGFGSTVAHPKLIDREIVSFFGELHHRDIKKIRN